MRGRVVQSFLIMAIASVAAGCATDQEWSTWSHHGAHFASGTHLVFSLRNQDGRPEVTGKDVVVASREGWWGQPVVVRPDEIQAR